MNLLLDFIVVHSGFKDDRSHRQLLQHSRRRNHQRSSIETFPLFFGIVVEQTDDPACIQPERNQILGEDMGPNR